MAWWNPAAASRILKCGKLVTRAVFPAAAMDLLCRTVGAAASGEREEPRGIVRMANRDHGYRLAYERWRGQVRCPAVIKGLDM